MESWQINLLLQATRYNVLYTESSNQYFDLETFLPEVNIWMECDFDIVIFVYIRMIITFQTICVAKRDNNCWSFQMAKIFNVFIHYLFSVLKPRIVFNFGLLHFTDSRTQNNNFSLITLKSWHLMDKRVHNSIDYFE